jgi:hypothetical protein
MPLTRSVECAERGLPGTATRKRSAVQAERSSCVWSQTTRRCQNLSLPPEVTVLHGVPDDTSVSEPLLAASSATGTAQPTLGASVGDTSTTPADTKAEVEGAPHRRARLALVAAAVLVLLGGGVAVSVRLLDAGGEITAARPSPSSSQEMAYARCRDDLAWGIQQLVEDSTNGETKLLTAWGSGDERIDVVEGLYRDYVVVRSQSDEDTAQTQALMGVGSYCRGEL